jgi:hypothetical protein
MTPARPEVLEFIFSLCEMRPASTSSSAGRAFSLSLGGSAMSAVLADPATLVELVFGELVPLDTQPMATATADG